VKATEVTAGLAESNGRLLPGLWRDSLYVTCGLTACTPGSAPGPTLGNEYGKTLPFFRDEYDLWLCDSVLPMGHMQITPIPHHTIFTGRMLFLTPNHQCQSTEGKLTTYSGLIFYYQHSRLPCLSPWAFIILGALKNRHFSSVLNWPIVTNHNKIRLITTQNVVIAKITSRVIASQPINTPILPVSSIHNVMLLDDICVVYQTYTYADIYEHMYSIHCTYMYIYYTYMSVPYVRAAVLTIWNSFPDSVRSSDPFNSFRWHLKTAAFSTP